MSKKKSKKNKLSPVKTFPIIRHFLLASLFLILAIFLLLSLLSFDKSDLQILNAGFNTATELPKNFFGFFGANIAKILFFLFGGVAYFIPVIIFICAARRLFLSQVRCHWEYFLGIGLMIMGLTIFMGLYPEAIDNPLTATNTDRTLAAGVIGQRFSNPSAPLGWIFRVLNHGGCQLTASFLFFGGFSIIWINDWHSFFVAKIKKLFSKNNSPKENTKKPQPIKEESTSPKTSLFTKLAALFEREPKLETSNFNENNDIFNNLNNQRKANTPPIQPQLNLNDTAAIKPPPPSQIITAPQTKKSTSFMPTLDGPYQLPSIDLLAYDQNENANVNQNEIEDKRNTLQNTFYNFRVNAEVTNVVTGPRVALFEITPAPGVNVANITKLRNNIAMDMKAESLRILAPIPGKGSVGIEVPNTKAAPVSLRRLLESNEWRSKNMQIPLALGRGIAGDAVCLDLAKAPHLLIAGATGSGKSVCMNTIIASMLYRFSPDDLKLILVDPKVVEFKNYETLPHLVTPVVNDPKRVTMALNWAVKEMDRRYRILAKVGVKNLESFNNRPPSNEVILDHQNNPIPAKLPFLVVIIDELADIMMTAKGDVEVCLARIAQLGRASGVHAIVATQRPSVNVITGVIKANFPTRIAFKVSSGVDSRCIIDSQGAEQLLGQGDMLFSPPGASGQQRVQGAFVPENELEDVVNFVSAQQSPQFDLTVTLSDDELAFEDNDLTPSPGFSDDDVADSDEALYKQAIAVIENHGKASTSFIQRQLRIGYNRAATLIELLEKRNVIGPQIGSSPREILIATKKDS